MSGAPARRSPPAKGNSKSISAAVPQTICRRVTSAASGPSGVSCIGTIAAASSAAGTSTRHHTRMLANLRLESAGRSAAKGSAVSNTACTSVPNVAPIGRSAIGDGTSAPTADVVSGISATSSSSSTTSGSLLTGRRLGGADQPEYDVRRHAASIARWKCRASRVVARYLGGSAGTGRASDRSMTRPPAASHSVNRAMASSSEILSGEQRSGTAVSPGRRPRSRRDSPPLGSSYDGAHHATTWELRARHRHVHQPAVIAGVLFSAQTRHRVEVGAVHAADVQTTLVAVVEQHQVAVLHIAVERERADTPPEIAALWPPTPS